MDVRPYHVVQNLPGVLEHKRPPFQCISPHDFLLRHVSIADRKFGRLAELEGGFEQVAVRFVRGRRKVHVELVHFQRSQFWSKEGVRSLQAERMGLRCWGGEGGRLVV